MRKEIWKTTEGKDVPNQESLRTLRENTSEYWKRTPWKKPWWKKKWERSTSEEQENFSNPNSSAEILLKSITTGHYTL